MQVAETTALSRACLQMQLGHQVVVNTDSALYSDEIRERLLI